MEFISESPYKTPPMTVNVYDADNKIIDTFEAPAGYQLERYVSSIHPNLDLRIKMSTTDFNVKVFDNDVLAKIYNGVYQKKN